MSERQGPEEELPVELQALYRGLQPPPLADELDASDAETRRVVGWMQGAWRELEPPRRATTLRLLPRARGRRLARRAALVAAAVPLLCAAAVILRSLAGLDELPPPARVARRPQEPPAQEVEILDIRPDRVELRSGPVRLLLLGPPPPAHVEDPSGS